MGKGWVVVPVGGLRGLLSLVFALICQGQQPFPCKLQLWAWCAGPRGQSQDVPMFRCLCFQQWECMGQP